MNMMATGANHYAQRFRFYPLIKFNVLTKQQTSYNLFDNRRRIVVVLFCLMALAIVTVALDLLFSKIQNTSFYLSESLLFSTFWLLFFPLLSLQLKLNSRTKKIPVYLLITALVTVLHLLIYPAMIWLLSMAFYNHTFLYEQTFNFGVTEYLIKSVIIYSFAMAVIVIYKHKNLTSTLGAVGESLSNQIFITSLIVSDTNNIKVVLQTNDILYFSANSPYINIHHSSKKYLQNQTLKSIETQLNGDQFLRIHKSCIVNIFKVASYKSRMNGDYDITLSDDTQLRLSRNYLQNFKSAMESAQRLRVK